MDLDPSAQTIAAHPVGDAGNTRQVHREQSDVAAIRSVDDVQAAAKGIGGERSAHPAAARTEFGLFVAGLEYMRSRRRKRRHVGGASVGIAGVEHEKQVLGIRVRVDRRNNEAGTTGELSLPMRMIVM